MFWEEETDPVQDDREMVVDVLFSMACKRIPVDHAYALSQAIQGEVSWLRDHPGAGIHTIYAAGSQNGWERPARSQNHYLLLSRRTRLRIRIPREQLPRLREALRGKSLDIGGCALRIGERIEVQPLRPQKTLLSRHLVMAADDQPEEALLQQVASELNGLGIRVRKALCGKAAPLATPTGSIPTRSLLLSGLSPEESIHLQQVGLGPHRALGCGLFIPYKGIDAVQAVPR